MSELPTALFRWNQDFGANGVGGAYDGTQIGEPFGPAEDQRPPVLFIVDK